MDCESFKVWAATQDPESLRDFRERLAEGACTGDCPDGVACWSRHRVNATNAVISGVIETDDGEIGFVMESGNNAGDVMLEWGPAEDVGTYEPPPHDPLVFLPVGHLSDHTLCVYHAWRGTKWFKGKERSMAYDLHFDPSSRTRAHYRDWAAKKGLTIGHKSDIPTKPAPIKRDVRQPLSPMLFSADICVGMTARVVLMPIRVE